MAKVLSTSFGKIKTTSNNKPPVGKPNIGPGSTAGSRSGSVKPTGGKTAPMYNFNAGTMPQKKSGTQKNTSVKGHGTPGSPLPRAKGAMPKFGGGK